MNAKNRLQFRLALALALAWLALGSPATPLAQAATAPRITQIALDGNLAHVSITVPAGTRRLILETTRRDDLQGWTPRTVRRLDGTAQSLTLELATDAAHELVRVRAESDDPLAAFASARTNVAPTPLPAGTTPALRNGSMVYDSAVAPPGNVPIVESGGQRAVTESDIWNRRGSRLYFFNQLRGLQVIDVSNPDAPALLGTLGFPAAGEQLYAPDDQHVVLLLREDCRGNGFSGASVVVVDVTAAQPREIARLPIAGRLFESRMVGTALYVASQTYEESSARNGIWESATILSSFDLAQPGAPIARDTRRIPGSATVVTASPRFFFVGQDVYHPTLPRSTELHALDITSPDGAIRTFTSLTLDGWIRDKFKLDVQDDVLRVVVESQEKRDRWSPITRLTTWRLIHEAEGPSLPLGKLDLGAGENLFGTRFDGHRAYVVTFRRIDPLWIVDLSNPAQPTILGELEIPGWSNYLLPMGDRLLTVGIDDTTQWRAAVQLFDVSQPAKPALLAKVPLGDQWSYSEANSDEKALGVFPEDGLILIPFTGSSSDGYTQSVQIIDLRRDTLQARGAIVHPDLVPRRSTVLGNRVLSLSARELLSADIANRDQPRVVARLELSRRVDRVVATAQHLLTFAGTDLQVASIAAPDAVLNTVPLGKLPVLGATVRPPHLYLLQGVPASVNWVQDASTKDAAWVAVTNAGQVQLRVFDLAGLPALAEKAELNLETGSAISGTLEPLWPTDTTLVWSARSTGAYLYRYGLDVPIALNTGPVPVAASPEVSDAITSRAVVADAALPVDGRLAFWPGFWWGQPQSLLAFDVSDPAAPLFRGETISPAGALRTSRAFSGRGTVLFTEEFQESTVSGSNLVTWLETTVTLVTNTVLKTNITAIPLQEWVTNYTKVRELLVARSTSPWKNGLAAAGAFHSLLVDATSESTGPVLTWGDTASRLQADGTRRDPALPEPVALPTGVQQLAAGTYHSLALIQGQVWTWQSIDLLQQPPTPEDISLPQQQPLQPAMVAGIPQAQHIAAGHRHSLALAGGRVFSWGANGYGQLGRPAVEGDLPPAEIPGLEARGLAAGAYHSYLLLTDGSVAAFGRNDQSQLGGATVAPGENFARIPLPQSVRDLAAGAYHGVALLADGSVWTWGRNKEGQLGRPEVYEPGAPGVVRGLPPIRAIAASALATLAIDENGMLWIWGQLDPDLGTTHRVPGQLAQLGPVSATVAGRSHALVTLASGEAFALGNEDHAQLGNGAVFPIEAVFPEQELVYQPVYTYETNVVMAEEIHTIHGTREVSQWVPVYQWWQRHALNVVDYAAGGAAPVVRPAIAFPGELRGVAHDGELLFSVTQKIEGSTNLTSSEVLDVSAYDGVSVFVGESLVLSTNGTLTSQVEVTPDAHVLLTQGSWNTSSQGRLRILGLNGTRLEKIAETPLLSLPQETRLLGSVLFVRGLGTLEAWDLTQPSAPTAIPALDHGCVWYSLGDATGSAASGWWVHGGEYGTLKLAPR